MFTDRETSVRPVVTGPIVFKDRLTAYVYTINGLYEAPSVSDYRLGYWVAGYLDSNEGRLETVYLSPVYDRTSVIKGTVYVLCVGIVQVDHLLHGRLGQIQYGTFKNIILRNFIVGDSIRFVAKFSDLQRKFIISSVVDKMDETPLLKIGPLEFAGSKSVPTEDWEKHIFTEQAKPLSIENFPAGTNPDEMPVMTVLASDLLPRDEAFPTEKADGSDDESAECWREVTPADLTTVKAVSPTSNQVNLPATPIVYNIDFTDGQFYHSTPPKPCRLPVKAGHDKDDSQLYGIARGSNGRLTHYTVGEHEHDDNIPEHFKPVPSYNLVSEDGDDEGEVTRNATRKKYR